MPDSSVIVLFAVTNWLQIQLDRWNASEVRPEKVHYVQALASQIERSRYRYETVSAATGVPWRVVACIHNMEGSLDFRTNLANGDPLTSKTRHVPRGRPPGNPPFTWEEAAVDALRLDHMDSKSWVDIPHRLNNIELYNGSGYQKYHPRVPTPYLWSWTNLYKRGKYVADGKWSDTAVSDQCGVVPIFKLLPP